MNFCEGALARCYFIFHQFLFHKLQKRFRRALKKQRELLILAETACISRFTSVAGGYNHCYNTRKEAM